MSKQETALIEKWDKRQQTLAGILEACGATQGQQEIDWYAGKVEWADTQGKPLAQATMKALCSYSYPDESLLMAWAQGQGVGAVIDPVPDAPAEVDPCSEGDAWLWAMRLADESEADYLYRVSGGDYLVFLGLWHLTPAVDKSSVEAGSADSFVLGVLDKMAEALRQPKPDAREMRRLFINQGQSLLQNRAMLAPDSTLNGLVTRVGDTLIDVGSGVGHRRFGILPPEPLGKEEVAHLLGHIERLRTLWLRERGQ